jgi:glycosyltransferase involved in cell wall biosynthesis
MQPIASFITTIYNRENYLAQSIESALAQTEPNFELILLDDGSTDGSVEVAQRYADADPRVRLIKAKHQGRGLALSTACSFASGKYLALLDSDDWLAPEALAETATVLEALSEVSMVYSNYYDVSEAGKLLRLGHRCGIPYSRERLLLDFMVFHFRLFRRTALEQVGGIDPEFDCAPDYDLSLKLSEVGEVIHLEKALYFYRQHENSISAARQMEQIHYSHKAVTQALKRRGLAAHLSVEVQLRPKLVFKRNPVVLERPTTERPKVFGIGLGKTGTTSLCAALGLLGYRTIHLPTSMDSLQAYDAAADTSVAVAFRELDWRYPNAKFVLTIRPVTDWVISWEKHDQKIQQMHQGELPQLLRQLRIRAFGQCQFDPVVWESAYQRHYEEVLQYFANRPQQLLIYELCVGEGWERLCNFLGQPLPKMAFPHQNQSLEA